MSSFTVVGLMSVLFLLLSWVLLVSGLTTAATVVVLGLIVEEGGMASTVVMQVEVLGLLLRALHLKLSGPVSLAISFKHLAECLGYGSIFFSNSVTVTMEALVGLGIVVAGSLASSFLACCLEEFSAAS